MSHVRTLYAMTTTPWYDWPGDPNSGGVFSQACALEASYTGIPGWYSIDAWKNRDRLFRQKSKGSGRGNPHKMEPGRHVFVYLPPEYRWQPDEMWQWRELKNADTENG